MTKKTANHNKKSETNPFFGFQSYDSKTKQVQTNHIEPREQQINDLSYFNPFEHDLSKLMKKQ
jgi:hypothetical protein